MIYVWLDLRKGIGTPYSTLVFSIPHLCRKQSLTEAVYLIVLGNLHVSSQQKLPTVTNYIQFYEQSPLETEVKQIFAQIPQPTPF